MGTNTKLERIAFRVDDTTYDAVVAARDYINKKHSLRLNVTDVMLLCVDNYIAHFKRHALKSVPSPVKPELLGLPQNVVQLESLYQQKEDEEHSRAAEDKAPYGSSPELVALENKAKADAQENKNIKAAIGRRKAALKRAPATSGEDGSPARNNARR